MPDIGAEGREDKAEAHQRSTAKSCGLASTGPPPSKQRKEKWHGEVHDAVGGSANDAGNARISLQRPVILVVFLEDAIAHGKACVGKGK